MSAELDRWRTLALSTDHADANGSPRGAAPA